MAGSLIFSLSALRVALLAQLGVTEQASHAGSTVLLQGYESHFMMRRHFQEAGHSAPRWAAMTKPVAVRQHARALAAMTRRRAHAVVPAVEPPRLPALCARCVPDDTGEPPNTVVAPPAVQATKADVGQQTATIALHGIVADEEPQTTQDAQQRSRERVPAQHDAEVTCTEQQRPAQYARAAPARAQMVSTSLLLRHRTAVTSQPHSRHFGFLVLL